MAATHDDVVSWFKFYPSLALAIVALALFIIFSFTVLALTIKTRVWYMVIVTIVGLLEAGGFICRILMFKNAKFSNFLPMQCLLIIPPSFLALVQYLTLGKAIEFIQTANPEKRLMVKPRFVVWGFFGVELAALALQGAGAGNSVSQDGPPKNATLGKALLIVGLVALVVLILCYLGTAIYVNLKPVYGIRQSQSMTRLFFVLYACSTLLLIRNIFRLVEFSQGFQGAIARQEGYFYGFDSLLILFILMLNTIFHFGIYLQKYPLEVKQARASVTSTEIV